MPWKGMTIQKLAKLKDERDAAWTSLNEAQAETDAKIRHPTRKDVTSDVECRRLARMRWLYKTYLRVFIKGFGYRDLGLRQEITNFFTEFFTLDSDEQKEAASDFATDLSKEMALYCQAIVDPYLKLAEKTPLDGYYIPCDEDNFKEDKIILSYIAEEFIKISPDTDVLALCEAVVDAVETKKTPSEWMKTRIVKASQRSKFKYAAAQGIPKKLIDDASLQNAFCAAVTQLCIDGNEVAQEAGLAVATLSILLPEGAGGDVPGSISAAAAQKLQFKLDRWTTSINLEPDQDIENWAQKSAGNPTDKPHFPF